MGSGKHVFGNLASLVVTFAVALLIVTGLSIFATGLEAARRPNIANAMRSPQPCPSGYETAGTVTDRDVTRSVCSPIPPSPKPAPTSPIILATPSTFGQFIYDQDMKRAACTQALAMLEQKSKDDRRLRAAYAKACPSSQ